MAEMSTYDCGIKFCEFISTRVASKTLPFKKLVIPPFQPHASTSEKIWSRKNVKDHEGHLKGVAVR